MKIESLDPRISRSNINDIENAPILGPMNQLQTYEVFVQSKRGVHHNHVGSVHAGNAEIALLFAKEQYARRGRAVNIWVVKTADIATMAYEDSDIFDTLDEKTHRNPESYKVMDRIKSYKERNAK